MFTNHKAEQTDLDHAIAKVFSDMKVIGSADEKFNTCMEHLERLYKLKEIDNNVAPKKLSPDTIAIVVGNLAGILMIIGHERANVLTSKALNFVLRAR